jgi:hypothetical protein
VDPAIIGPSGRRLDLACEEAHPRNNNQSNESGGAASEKAKETEGQIILCNPKKPESESIAAAARANTKFREAAAANKYSRTAVARPTNEESTETLVSDEACSRCRCCGSRLDRA